MKSSSDYQEKLKHPKWQKKRLRILERAGWKCQSCDEENETLHVHHLIYSGGEPWDTPDENLEALCESCHEFREDFNTFFAGRSKVATRFCYYFWRFFYPAFDGTAEIAIRCEQIGELYQKINQFHLKAEKRGEAQDSLDRRTDPDFLHDKLAWPVL